MEWPTAMIILGVLGNVALAIMKFIPTRKDKANIEVSHYDLKANISSISVEMHDGFREVNNRIDKILLHKG